MKFLFQKLLIVSVFLCAFCQVIFAQGFPKSTPFQVGIEQIKVQFDSIIGKKYDQTVETFCLEYRAAFDEMNKGFLDRELGGLAVFSISKVDTLNRSELKYPGFELEKNKDGPNCFEVFIAVANQTDNKLVIELGVPFGNQFISHEVQDGRVQTWFREYYKDDKIVKLNVDDPFTSELSIATQQVKFVLSSRHFQKGDVIFGYCEFETLPYYLQDMYLEPTLNIKRVYKYFFKTLIR